MPRLNLSSLSGIQSLALVVVVGMAVMRVRAQGCHNRGITRPRPLWIRPRPMAL
jgi:hypothetical protein